MIPQAWIAVAECDGLPYRVTIHVEAADGVPRITSATLDQCDDRIPVTGNGFRKVPLARILRLSVNAVACERTSTPVGADVFSWPAPRADVATASQEVDSERRRWWLTDDHLRNVAEIYAAASTQLRPDTGRAAPVEAVAEAFDVPRDTAAHWIKTARARDDPETGLRFIAPTGRPRRSTQQLQEDM